MTPSQSAAQGTRKESPARARGKSDPYDELEVVSFARTLRSLHAANYGRVVALLGAKLASVCRAAVGRRHECGAELWAHRQAEPPA